MKDAPAHEAQRESHAQERHERLLRKALPLKRHASVPPCPRMFFIHTRNDTNGGSPGMKNAPLEELRKVSPAQQGEPWNALGSSSPTPRIGAAMFRRLFIQTRNNTNGRGRLE